MSTTSTDRSCTARASLDVSRARVELAPPVRCFDLMWIARAARCAGIARVPLTLTGHRRDAFPEVEQRGLGRARHDRRKARDPERDSHDQALGLVRAPRELAPRSP